MPSPTVQQIKDYARQRLGDTRVSGGGVYTDDGSGGKISLQLAFEPGYRLIYRVLDENGIAFVNRNYFFLLPAYSGYIDPTTAIDNFGEPVSLRTRPLSASLVISAVADDAAAQECTITTAASHGLVNGDHVLIYGITDSGLDRINDEWPVKVTGAAAFKLLGCTVSGTYTTGGVVVLPTGSWSREYTQLEDIADLYAGIVQQPAYIWDRNRFTLIDSTSDRVVRIRFSLSGSPPSSDDTNVGIDDSLDFFGTYTAAKACSVNSPSMSQTLLAEAIGNRLDEYNPRGHLGFIVDQGINTLNLETHQGRRFRDQRNTGSMISFGVRSA